MGGLILQVWQAATASKGFRNLKTKQINQAIENYNQIIALGKEGILADDAYYLMAGLYENEIKDLEKAKEYYQKIIFDFPSSIYLVDARKKFRKLRGDSI